MVEALRRQAAAFAAKEGAGAELAGGLAGGVHVAGNPDLRVTGLGHRDQGGGGSDHVHNGAHALGVGRQGARQQFNPDVAHRRMVCQRPDAKRTREATAMVM